MEVFDTLPSDGELTTKGKIIDVMDKKSGALAVSQSKYIKFNRIYVFNTHFIIGDTFDRNGRLLVRNQSSTFIVGAGNFGGKKTPNGDVVPCVPVPTRKPDASVLYKTSADQAALYR